MGLYSHVLLHSVGTDTTVAHAMLEGIPTVDSSIFSAPFEDTTHSLEGSMDIILKPTAEYLIRFNSDFSTGNGPGVYVYLIQTGLKPTKSDFELGPLKSLNGTQEYLVPESLNIFPFAYVLVHCKPCRCSFWPGCLKNNSINIGS